MSISMLVMLASIFTIQSCKKEPDQVVNSKSGTNQNDSKNKNGILTEEGSDYSEETIEQFISNIIYYRNSSSEDLVNPNEVLPLMQTTVNYCYSDIDTSFSEELETDSITFTIEMDGEGFIYWTDLSAKMDAIADAITDKTVLVGDGPTRLITSWLTRSSDGEVYTAYFKFGKTAYYAYTETYPTPPEVTGTGFQWNLQAASCSMSAQQKIRDLGRTYMLDIRNYNISHAGYDAGMEGYLNGNFAIYRVNLETGFFAQNVSGASTTGFPGGSFNGYAPTTSAIFEINSNAATYNGGVYELCLTKGLVDYYIARTQSTFDYLKPSVNAYCLASIFGVYSGTTTRNGDLYLNHMYTYNYTLHKTRAINHSVYK